MSEGPKIKIGSVFGGGTRVSSSATTKPPAQPSTPPPSVPTVTTRWNALTEPIQLHPGKTYFARLALSGLERTFASAGHISDEFEKRGFRQVCVWMNPAELAEFPSTAMPTGILAKQGPFAAGVWGGNLQQGVLPSQVKEVWERTT